MAAIKDLEVANSKGPLQVSRVTLAVCALIAGFLLVFLQPPSRYHAGLPLLHQHTWVEHYVRIITHPVTFFVEIAWLCAAFSKSVRGWWMVLSGAIVGLLVGGLVHRLLQH